jgi:hypothetical protein
MHVERNDQNDVVMYYILCPECKQYNALNPKNKQDREVLDGIVRFWCKSANCTEGYHSRTLLEVVRGRAVVVNNFPKPDLKAPEPGQQRRLWRGMIPGHFAPPRNNQN